MKNRLFIALGTFALVGLFGVPALAEAAYSVQVSPESGESLNFQSGKTFTLEITAVNEDGIDDLYELEVDIRDNGEPYVIPELYRPKGITGDLVCGVQGVNTFTHMPEFSVYADTGDPYGGGTEKDLFNNCGVNVSYDSVGKWTIDVGEIFTHSIANEGGIDLYFVLKDSNGEVLWGSMEPTTPDNTFAYTVGVSNDYGQPEVTKTRPRRGGGSRRVVEDRKEEPEVEETKEATVFEFDGVEYDLSSLTEEELIDLINELRARLIELIMAYIAELQSKLLQS